MERICNGSFVKITWELSKSGWSLLLPPTLSLLSLYWTFPSIGRLLKDFVTLNYLTEGHDWFSGRTSFLSPLSSFSSFYPSPFLLSLPLDIDTQKEIIVAQVSGKLNKDLWRKFNKHLVVLTTTNTPTIFAPAIYKQSTERYSKCTLRLSIFIVIDICMQYDEELVLTAKNLLPRETSLLLYMTWEKFLNL